MREKGEILHEGESPEDKRKTTKGNCLRDSEANVTGVYIALLRGGRAR